MFWNFWEKKSDSSQSVCALSGVVEEGEEYQKHVNGIVDHYGVDLVGQGKQVHVFFGFLVDIVDFWSQKYSDY